MTRALALVLALAAAGQLSSPGSQRPAPVFRSGVDVVRLDVSAVDRTGAPLRGLMASDFTVTDNGASQQVTSVEGARLPLSVQLALDTSASVSGSRLHHLIAAADGLLSALRPGDRAGLVTFSHVLRRAAPLTDDLVSVRTALARIDGDGRTALRDAVQLAVSMPHADGYRPLTLVFTDGVDNASWLTDEAVLDSARRAGIVVHTIRVTGREDSPSQFVEQLVATTGGRVWSASSERDLERLFTSALEEMRARYLLTFSPSGRARPGWHELKVRLKRGGSVTARRGYFVVP
jgi:Ca-activated chloride channel family protein